MRAAKDIEREVIEREWPLDADGYPHRQAARVVLINPAGETYLIHGHDVDDPNFKWWFTVGGGIMPGESAPAAAVRELAEETGLAAGAERLEGPVLFRQATFRFVGSVRKQDEQFFLLRLSAAEAQAVTEGKHRALTALEQHVLDENGWFSPAQIAALAAVGQYVFPQELASYLHKWLPGWDGVSVSVDA